MNSSGRSHGRTASHQRWRANGGVGLPLVLAAIGAGCQPYASSENGRTVETTSAEIPPGVLRMPAEWVERQIAIPEGTYSMGSSVGDADEQPVHAVHVQAFEMDVTEVTVASYAACVRAHACPPAGLTVRFPGITPAEQRLYEQQCNGDRVERREYAQNCVDHAMARAYCEWRGERLPTEEEWEYAACGGTCDGSARTAGEGTSLVVVGRWPFATSVSMERVGPFGLYDMADNVWEWTSSRYCPYDHPTCSDSRVVVRGGSWSAEGSLQIRVTDRSPTDPTTRDPNIGFRCARSPLPSNGR